MTTPELTLFQRFMICVYTDQSLKYIIDTLSDETFDYTENDNQFLRELNCGRLDFISTLKIYSTLVEKRKYIMTTKDMNCLINQINYERT